MVLSVSAWFRQLSCGGNASTLASEPEEDALKVIRNVGVVFGVAVLTSATLFLLGVATSLVGNMGWVPLGEYQPWLPLIGLEYGFPLGIFVGVIVAVRRAATPN